MSPLVQNEIFLGKTPLFYIAIYRIIPWSHLMINGQNGLPESVDSLGRDGGDMPIELFRTPNTAVTSPLRHIFT